ncbi:hypothetical protein [Phenylobacterium sp.]|jgi:hypothetical protein|uniref:hypothetical protein n=1 Tax=Phenylobacterium sp. TaxID=1871053 RepID=UPI0027314F94|nr:hypothetical protein [Phenylobacterium sp.]MDP1873632.1 hypothetical protein [Phenylobacterium sp.]
MAQAPEGTVIKLQDGSTRVKRGGQWIPAGNLFQGGAPKLEPQERTQLKEARQRAQTATGTINQLDRFMTVNRETPTGEFGGLPIVRNVRAMFDPNVAEMNSIVERLTPAQREPGSGVMSDADIKMYRASVVGVDKPGPANTRISALGKAGASRERDYAAYLDYYAKVNGTLNGAQEQWDAYAAAEPVYDPTAGTVRKATPWRQYFGIETPAPSAGGRQGGAAPPSRGGTAVKVGNQTYTVREKP